MFPISKIQPLKTLILCLPLLLVHCSADKKKSKKSAYGTTSMFDKLSNDDLLEFELVADFDSLLLTKEQEKYYPATLSFVDENDSLLIKKIKVGTRGKTRKNICDLPPLRLKFPKPLLRKSNLAKYKTLKLVTPCKEGESEEDLIRKELLCYELYQVLTEKSFRAQPAQVQIKQSESEQPISNKLAFLIENDKEMAKRLGGKLLDKSVAKVKTIDIESYNMLVLFQYMIGNTDWNLSRRHNIKLVKVKGNSAPIPVPYDFDYSGLVNAEYAIPHPDLPIKNIRERLFQWRGKNADVLKKPINQLLEKKSELFTLLENCQLKNKKAKTEMISYVKEFFEIIEKDGGVEALVKK